MYTWEALQLPAIWFAELGEHPDSCVQEGCRPVLILSNNVGNDHGNIVTVAPLTSKQKKWWIPAHVMLEPFEMEISGDFNKPFEAAMALMEQLTTIDKSALKTYVGRVTDDVKITEIEAAVRIQLGMEEI